MKKQTKIISSILIVLILFVGILLYFNKDLILQGKQAQEDKSIKVTYDIKEDHGKTKTLTKDDILNLPYDTFDAEIRSNGKKAKIASFQGVLLSNLLDHLKLDKNEIKNIIVKAADGYTVTIGIDEVLEKDNVYITYKQDGEMMKSMDEGGVGPYQLVIRNDQFSQRWCKYVSEVEIR